MAAPVGHALTHEAPPSMSLHISHLAATDLAPSTFLLFVLSSPGPGPAPKKSQDHRPGFLAGG